MIRTLVAAAAALFAAGAFAATDVNTATQADLEALRGIGPVQAKLILSEREKGPFKNWTDFKDRVKGVGPTASKRYSEAGMTVNGSRYSDASTRKSRAAASERDSAKPGYAAETKAAAKEGAAGIGPGFRQMGEGVKQMGRNAKDATKEQASDAKSGAKDMGSRMSNN